jgi:RNA polymerase sigma-70 factor (ECF subfamily)
LQDDFPDMDSFSDIKHFNALFNKYYSRFILFAKGYVKEVEIAEDFVSEAFTAYWENKENLLPETNPQAYILTIIKNKCLNYLHHQQVKLRVKVELEEHAEWLQQTKISTLEACDPDFLFSMELQQIIDETLNKLPQKTRKIFFLSRNQGLTYKQIAEKTHLNQKTIEFHISKALQQLRLSLSDFITFGFFLILF